MRSGLMGAAVAAGMLASGSVLAQETVPVGPDEVQRELVGKVWDVELPNGKAAVENFKADGTVTITGGLNDRGYWRLWEQGYCTTWFRMRNGAERCFTVRKTADGKYEVYKPDGDISITILNTKPVE
jgi:hypothetical protein